MKKFLLAIVVCFLCLSLGVLGASAEATIEIKPNEYKTVSKVRVKNDFIGFDRGGCASYEVNFTNLPTLVEMNVGTDKSSSGIIELRLGNDKGEIIASINAKEFLTQDTWGKTVCTAAIKKELKGKQTIFVCYGGYALDFHGMTFYGSDAGIKRKMVSQPADDEFRDISDEPNRNKINALAQLGIIDNTSGIYNPKLPMTRRMFVSMLGRAINAELYAQDNLPFSDILKDDPDAKIFAGMYNLGIVNGTAEGKFNPLGFIKPYEAAIICTRTLGYTFTNIKDTDLVELAISLKLFRGVDSGALALTKSDGAAIIYRMLLSDFMMPQGLENGNICYEPQKDVMHKYSSIKYGKGLVTENYYTSLYKSKKFNGKISIDGKNFLPGDTEASSYLGVMSEYFYTESNGEKILKAITPCDSVDVTVFESAPQKILKKLTENKIEYYDGDELVKVELNSQTSIIFNGIALDAPLSSLVNVNEFVGKITMIDNDGDGVQDCVWIDSAENVLVSGISGKRIFDELSKTSINTSDGNFELYLDGTSQMLKSLKTGTVLTLYRSANRTGDRLVRATSNLTQVSGMISELRSGVAVIDTQEYIISDDCAENLNAGDSGLFSLNDFGHIVHFEANAESLMVGLLLGVDPGQGGLDTVSSVRILTQDNGIVIVNAAERVIADGVTIKSGADLYNGYGSFDGLSNVRLFTPCLYKLNADGKLCLIDTVAEGSRDKNDGLTRLATSDSYRHYGGVLVTASGWTMKYPVLSKAKVIQLYSGDLEEHHKIVTGLSTGDEAFTATPYSSTSDSMIADIVVWENCTNGIGKWESPFVVTETREVYDNVQNTVLPSLYGYNASNQVAYTVDEQTYQEDADFKKLIDSLKPGDIVLPGTTNGHLSLAEIVLLSSGQQTNAAGVNAILSLGGTYSKDGNSQKGKVVFGKVVRVENGYIQVQYGTPDKYEVFKVSGAQVASVDKTGSRGVTVINKMNNTSIFEGQYIVGHVNKVSFQMSSVYVLHDIVSE